MPNNSARLALLLAAMLAATGAALPPEADAAEAPETIAERSPGDQRQGDEAAPQMLAQFGGEYDDPALAAYVDEIGRRLVAVSEQADEPWTFTVLDSPTINAFALPGGQVYVTRGLVGLANSEAELAGVIGHEIGHVTAGHAGSRQTRGAVATGLLIGARILGSIVGIDRDLLDAGGQLGQLAAGGILADYSREDEMVADQLGVRYLAGAGYDPYAQADFLESLADAAALDARMRGRTDNPNSTSFFSSHPATPERARQAVELARDAGAPVARGDARYRDRYLDAIRGITHGDSREQGFVRGRTFSHPVLGFTFTVPEGFEIVNSADAVRATGPEGARFIMDGAPNPAASLERYIEDTWVPAISRQFPVGIPERVRSRRLNGMEAATAVLPATIGGRQHEVLLTVVRMDGKLYRLAGLAPRGAGVTAELEDATETFRRLSRGEAASLVATEIEIVTVRRDDTVASLAQRMKVGEFAEERFRLLNALEPDEEVRRGEKVKLVR